MALNNGAIGCWLIEVLIAHRALSQDSMSPRHKTVVSLFLLDPHLEIIGPENAVILLF